MGSGFVFGVIPTQIVIAVVLTVATAWMLKHTRMGRELYIAGANPNAARFSGLKVEKSVILGFVLSGALAALAGIVYLGRLGAAEAEIGNQFHFQCVSAVAIGGISFAGGAGSAWGAVIGALILNILINGMNLLNISSYWQGTVNGVWSDHHYRSSFRLYSQKKADKIRGSINYKTNNIKKIGGKHYDEESSVNNDSSFYSSSHDGRMHIQRIIHNGSD